MRELREKLENGKIGKKEYADAMMAFHRILMQYPELLKNSHFVQGIEISDGGGDA